MRMEQKPYDHLVIWKYKENGSKQIIDVKIIIIIKNLGLLI